MKPTYYYDIEQGSLAWWTIKSLKATASNATAIANWGKGLNTLVRNMIRSNPQELFIRSQTPLNEDTERGKAYEGEAVEEYEKQTGVKTKRCGFIKYNSNIGCSPDFLIGDDGGGEVKCRNLEKHNKIVATNKMSSSTMWQIQMSLLISKRKYWDFVAYNPLGEKPIVIIRVYPDKEKFKKLRKGFKLVAKMIKEFTSKPLW